MDPSGKGWSRLVERMSMDVFFLILFCMLIYFKKKKNLVGCCDMTKWQIMNDTFEPWKTSCISSVDWLELLIWWCQTYPKLKQNHTLGRNGVLMRLREASFCELKVIRRELNIQDRTSLVSHSHSWWTYCKVLDIVSMIKAGNWGCSYNYLLLHRSITRSPACRLPVFYFCQSHVSLFSPYSAQGTL